MFGHEKVVRKMGAAFPHTRSKTMSCDYVAPMFGHVPA